MKRTSVALAVLLASGCGYNRIQSLDEQVSAYASQIEVQLQRRADLIPNLVETVKGVAQQETTVIGQVTEARARLGGAIQNGDLGQMADANAGLSSALSRLLVVVENYPDLRSSESFQGLQVQLEGTENRISTARQDYNNAVREHNAYIRRFPQVLTAKVIGAKERAYFEVTAPEARDVPKVDFNQP